MTTIYFRFTVIDAKALLNLHAKSTNSLEERKNTNTIQMQFFPSTRYICGFGSFRHLGSFTEKKNDAS